MLLHIPTLLHPPELERCRALMLQSLWVDGRSTAGTQAMAVKRNRQVAEDSPTMAELRTIVTTALERNPLFISAALPNRILAPYFNHYEGGEHYGDHIDNAIRRSPGDSRNYRADLSTTVFFTEPDDYEGGELVVKDTYGTHEVKLPAGDAILYPATSLHCVSPVTQGSREAAFLWTQSLVRDDWQRNMLFDLDMTIQSLRSREGESTEAVALTGHYHNLLRMWAET